MRSFKDAMGREWAIPPITVGTNNRLRQAVGLDLRLAAPDPAELDRKLADPDVLHAALWELCHRHPAAPAVTRDEFADVLTGDAMDEAREQLNEAVIDFFPSRAGRAAIRARLAPPPDSPTSTG